MPGHIQRNLIGYCTIIAGVVNVLILKLESSWPHTAQDWTLLTLAVIGAICSTLIGYRATPVQSQQSQPQPNQ
jgi:hypothetical protein